MKNERAIIMGLTYMIGFITAFIAYEYAATDTSVSELVYIPAPVQVATVIEATPTTSEEPVRANVRVRLDEEGLHYVTDTEEYIISIAETAGTDFADTGHVSIVQHSLSADNRFVYFCAIPNGGEDDCVSYVYDADVLGVYPVSAAGETLVTPVDEVRSVWASDGTLQINQYVSRTAVAPWVMQ